MKKNKYVLFMFLGMLIVLLLFIFFSIKQEGFDPSSPQCAWKYVGPNQPNPTISDNVIEAFIELFNNNMNRLGSDRKMDKNTYNTMIKNKDFCTEEVNWYVVHKFWPMNGMTFQILGLGFMDAEWPKPFTSATIAQGYSIRQIYNLFLLPVWKRSGLDWSDQRAALYIRVAKGETAEPECPFPSLVSEAQAIGDKRAFERAPKETTKETTVAKTKVASKYIPEPEPDPEAGFDESGDTSALDTISRGTKMQMKNVCRDLI